MATTVGTNALPVPTSTDTPDFVRDITALAEAVDPLLGAFVCTSTTRPASPVDGRIIYETDTGNLLIWATSQWNYIYFDTGWLNDTSNVGMSAVAAHCTSNGIHWRRINNTVWCYISVNATAAITISSTDGNATNTGLVQLTSDLTPAVSNGAFGVGTTGPLFSAYAGTAGLITFTASTPGATVAAGTTITLSGAYAL